LTAAEARRRLAADGPNEVGTGLARTSLLRQIGQALASPLVLLLLVAGAIALALGQLVDASLIVAMVLLSAALNVSQTFGSERAAERLRLEVAPTAAVLRDGAWDRILRREVVAGDRIRLAAGDLVPADARIEIARDLHVHEAALTGESLPVEKGVRGSEEDRRLFLGTSVVSGTAEAIVTAVGARTRFGDIAARLEARRPETEFERGMRQLSLMIMRTVVFLVLLVVLVGLVRHRDALQSLLFAVALAVGLTPEFLPMITAVTLARGAVRMARQKVIVKHLQAIQNFGSIDVLLSDKTGTLTSGEMALELCCDSDGAASSGVLELARINSSLQAGIRSPLDDAIVRDSHGCPPGCRKIDEIPFDFERRRLSVVVEREGRRFLIAKGAPETVLPLCRFAADGKDADAWGPTRLHRAEEFYRGLSERGLRVLAVASRELAPADGYSPRDETDLTLAGFVAFSDPILPDARRMVDALRRDGVRIKILTGDDERVARHVAAEVGLTEGGVLGGAELDSMTDSALGALAEKTSVFARVTPAQKNRILLALKRRGHVVGFLGDGINDAPSLHAADVGISAASAVDVAREAAEIILLEKSLRSLHRGILEGRRSFGNVMKYVLMETSSNFGNMFSLALASLFLPFLPMLPTQILLNNFLYDLAQVTIPTDRVDRGYVLKPQRWDVGLIRRFMLAIGPISSAFDLLTFWALWTVFSASETLFHTGWFVESLTTQALVLLVIRTAANPLKSRPSALLAVTTAAVVVTALALPFTPLAGPLRFSPPPASFYVFLAAVVASYLVCVELAKRRLLRAPDMRSIGDAIASGPAGHRDATQVS
jgi:Mg2+-importing ATPase